MRSEHFAKLFFLTSVCELWRCHRRIIADYLLARGVAVTHIMGSAKLEAATLTPGARSLPDGTILYAEPDRNDEGTP